MVSTTIIHAVHPSSRVSYTRRIYDKEHWSYSGGLCGNTLHVGLSFNLSLQYVSCYHLNCRLISVNYLYHFYLCDPEVLTLKNSFVDPESRVPYAISVCLARSSALSMGETILSTVRKAARLAVYDEMMIRVKNHHTPPTIRPDRDLHTHTQTNRPRYAVITVSLFEMVIG